MKKIKIGAFIIVLLSVPILFACNKECSHENILTSSVEPTCSKEGYTLNKCSGCSFEYKSDITAPLGHTLSESSFLPTCDTEGYTYYSCECGYSFKSDFVAPLGHTLTSEIFAPNCTDEGYTLYSCNCGYTHKSDFTPPKGHITTPMVVEPKCTEQGYTAYNCMVCDYSYASNYVQPTGHTLQKEVARPTAFSDGYTKHICDCGFEYTSDTILSEYIFSGAYLPDAGEVARGIDVSKWNGKIDWDKIKAAGIDFVIIKAGSTLGKDEMFEEHYAGAKAAGLDVGAYYFTYAENLDEALLDADYMLSWLSGKQFEYPIYFDIELEEQESLGSELLTDMCLAFITKMQENGYFCGLYTNNNWLTNILDSERLTPYIDVWLARYNGNYDDNWPDYHGEHTGMWQYSNRGQLDGHTCNFDLNITYKNYPRLIKDWGFNGF